MSFKELSSLQNPLVKHLVQVRQNADYRYDHRVILLDSKKVIEELSTKYSPKLLLTTDPNLIPDHIKAFDKIFVTSFEIIKKITGLVHPEGIVAEFDMPPFAHQLNDSRVLILDQISDPGNVGTLLRTADALGWSSVYLTEGTCDPYNDKSLRAARGSIFRLKLALSSKEEIISSLKDTHQLLVADLKGLAFNTLQPVNSLALVLSNEAKGPSAEFLAVGQSVTIEMQPGCESLNVAIAGGILMQALKQ